MSRSAQIRKQYDTRWTCDVCGRATHVGATGLVRAHQDPRSGKKKENRITCPASRSPLEPGDPVRHSDLCELVTPVALRQGKTRRCTCGAEARAYAQSRVEE